MGTLFRSKKKKTNEFEDEHKEIEDFYAKRRIEISDLDKEIPSVKREIKKEGEIEKKKEEEPIIPQMFECESCGNIFKDKWETCPACGGKIRKKDSGTISIETKKTYDEPRVPEKGMSQFSEKLPSIDDIFGGTRIPVTPSPDDKTIHETKVRQAPIDSLFSFEDTKPKAIKVKKIKKVKKAAPSLSFCPYCGKKLPPPVTGEWTFCLYCGTKLK